MRKDEIEARICRLEQDFREIRSENRQNTDTILSELRSFQGCIIEEKINIMKEQLEKRYRQLVMDLMLVHAHRHLDETLPEPCSVFERKRCLEIFFTHLQNVANRDTTTDRQHDGLPGESCDDQISRYTVLNDPPCRTCYDAYLVERNQITQAIRNLSESKSAMVRKNAPLFLSELPDDEVVTSLVEPISHKSRFAMLKALSSGSMTFKEFSELTGTKGGHLLYHVEKLVDAGLVAKIDGGSRYSITDRGMGVMDLVKKMYA
jgi:DNA-binding HxlR family transcriptional regulator